MKPTGNGDSGNVIYSEREELKEEQVGKKQKMQKQEGGRKIWRNFIQK